MACIAVAVRGTPLDQSAHLVEQTLCDHPVRAEGR